MASGEIRSKLGVFFMCLVLLECRSEPLFPGTLEEDDGGSESLSERPVLLQEGYDESWAGFHDLGDYADAAELPGEINGEHFSSSEAAWDAMSPELKCGEDLMKLQLNGPEVAKIVLCRDNGAPVPLTELPPHCGYSNPTFGGLVYATPYDGCGVIQQGRRYVIQFQWHGNFAVVSCPVMSTSANDPFLETNPLDESTSTSIEVLKPRAPGYPETFLQSFWPYNYPPYYAGKGYPTVKPADVLTQKPQQPIKVPVFWPYNYPPYHYPGKGYPTVKPADVLTQKPQQPIKSPVFWPYNYPPYNYPGKVKPTVAPVPTQKPQQPIQSPVFWPYNNRQYHYPGQGYPTFKPAGVPTQTPQQPIKYPVFWPYNYPPYYPGKVYPTVKPTVAPVPTQKPQQPIQSPVFWPYNYPPYHYPGQGYPTFKPADVPTQIPQQPIKSPVFWPYNYPPYNYPGKGYPTFKPTVAPVSTQKAQQPIKYPVFWPYNYPLYYPGKVYPRAKPGVAQVRTQKPQQPFDSPVYWPYYHHDKPVPTQKPQLPGNPQVSWPLYHTNHSHPGQPKEPAPVSPSPGKTQKLQPQMYPGELFPQHNHPSNLQPQYPQYPVRSTTPPITTTPQPCTASVKCKLPANQPPNKSSQNYMPPSFLRLEGKKPSSLN